MNSCRFAFVFKTNPKTRKYSVIFHPKNSFHHFFSFLFCFYVFFSYLCPVI